MSAEAMRAGDFDGPPLAELVALGWTSARTSSWDEHAAPGLVPGRMVSEERGSVQVVTAAGGVSASIAGHLRHAVETDASTLFPAVGDWVAVSDAGPGLGVVQAVLPRTSAIVRRGPADRNQPSQVLAANVDVAFLVTSLNAEFNLRRLERYVAVAWESSALPVVVLSKADLANDVEGHRVAAQASAPGVEVVVASAVTGLGLDAVRAHLAPGRTVVFIGSSGVGKSSLVNALGELALLGGDGLADAFGEIEAIALGCRFRDCRHESEPGCAIRASLADGSLDPDRLGAFRKLEREARRAELSTNAVARKAERRKWTAMVKGVGRAMDVKYGRER